MEKSRSIFDGTYYNVVASSQRSSVDYMASNAFLIHVKFIL